MAERASKSGAKRVSTANDRRVSSPRAGLAKIVPATPIPQADDVPATCGLVRAVRNELLLRIDHSESLLMSEIQTIKIELRAEMQTIKVELQVQTGKVQGTVARVQADVTQLQVHVTHLQADVTQLQVHVTHLQADVTQLQVHVTHLQADVTQLRADVTQLQADVAHLKADVTHVRTDVARMLVLMEEQNARNKVVLDGLAASFARHEHTEKRLDALEKRGG